MRIAKEFRWEMGHRLPFHKDKCRNIHGHSYKMVFEIEGNLDENGMILDYYEIKNIIQPMIDELDHSFIVKSDDAEVIDFLKKIDSKHVIIDFESTAENLVYYFLNHIKPEDLPYGIRKIKIRVHETENTYAEAERIIA